MLNIRTGGHRELERFYSVFDLDFDRRELLPKLALHKGMLSGGWELLIIYDEDSLMELGYALVSTKNLYGYVLLKYFAMLPWYREKGLGAEAMRLINKRYADKQGIVAELTELSGREDEKRMRKLKKFFSRFGYEEIKNDCHIGGADAHIMVKPIKGRADISPVAHRVIPDFYRGILNEYGTGKYIEVERV